MHQIQTNGVFLKTDGDGYLISDTGAGKIVSPWREAVEYAREIEVRRLGDRLHSLYLRGSTARGTALPGRSDLDLFAVLIHHQPDRFGPPAPWTPQESDEFHRRFPFVTGFENSHITLADVYGPFHYYRFVMKVSAVCVHGEDLLPQIPRYTTAAPIAEEWFRIFPHLVNRFVMDLGGSGEPQGSRRLCHDMMKGFLRAGMLLVMRRERAYTRDLYPSYECFSKHYPEQEPIMRQCLEWAVNPISDHSLLLPFAADLGGWMQRACEAEFGALELLPASLIGG
jgi:predicted nucleotidyltransferase